MRELTVAERGVMGLVTLAIRGKDFAQGKTITKDQKRAIKAVNSVAREIIQLAAAVEAEAALGGQNGK